MDPLHGHQIIFEEMLSSEDGRLVALGERLTVTFDDVVGFINDLISKKQALEKQNKRLEGKIAKMLRDAHGPKGDTPPDQPQNGARDPKASGKNSTQDKKKKTRRQKPKRKGKGKANWGENAVEVDRAFKTADNKCPCGCGGSFRSFKPRKSVVYIPARYEIEVRWYANYRCRIRGMLSVPSVPKVFPGGNIDNSFIAGVAVNKFFWGLPCYRQEQMLLNSGITMDRSTFNRYLNRVALQALSPIYLRMIESLLKSSTRLLMDETPVSILAPGTGKTAKFYMYAITRDDSTFGGTSPPMTVYFARPTRAKYHIKEILGDYDGLLQTDGYAGYNFYENRAECWAHARRHYSDAAIITEADDAYTAMEFIRRLYKIEDSVRGHSPDARVRVRSECSQPILDEFKDWLENALDRHLGESNVAKAIRYTLKRWDGLTKFVHDGRLDLDTNAVERQFKPIIRTRKNSYFAGSTDGADAWAIYSTLFETCKMHGLDSYKYLYWVLNQISKKLPRSRYDELLPWNAPEHCRTGHSPAEQYTHTPYEQAA